MNEVATRCVFQRENGPVIPNGTCPGGRHFLVSRDDLAEAAVERVLHGRPPSGEAHPFGSGGIAEPFHAIRQIGGAAVEQVNVAAVRKQLGRTVSLRCDARKATGSRFQQGQAERRVARGYQQHVRGSVVGKSIVNRAHNGYVLCKAEPIDQSLRRCHSSVADNDQVSRNPLA